jgi:protein tyrosine phosphatase
MKCYCYNIVNHRYGNIVPYNHNRVTLDHQVDGIDYVNASWIKNDDQTSQMPDFIAAQGTVCLLDICLYLMPLGQARQFIETCGT